MRDFHLAPVAIVSLLALVSCAVATESSPPRTATEEMLISTAAERAAIRMDLQMPHSTRVFVDASNFEGTDSKYALSAIRDAILKQGMRLADDKKTAQAIIEIRAGALSIDKNESLVGTPAFTIPIPFAASGITVPEIAFYKAEEQKGIAKFAATGYAAESGSYMASDGPTYGFSHKTKRTLLIFFSWAKDDYMPEGTEDASMRASDIGAQLPNSAPQ